MTTLILAAVFCAGFVVGLIFGGLLADSNHRDECERCQELQRRIS